jgi:hypothetical protein
MLEITLLKIPQLLFVALCMIIVASQMRYSTSEHDFCCILCRQCADLIWDIKTLVSRWRISHHKPFCCRSLGWKSVVH